MLQVEDNITAWCAGFTDSEEQARQFVNGIAIKYAKAYVEDYLQPTLSRYLEAEVVAEAYE